MKKTMIMILYIMVIALCMVGCGKGIEAFEEAEEGVIQYVDIENSPIEKGAVITQIKKGEDGYVKFVLADEKGNPTVEFFTFTPSISEMHRYRFVGAMGMSYNYYFNYENNELIKVTDADEKDVTMGLKDGGRWDKAVSECEEYNTLFTTYLKDNFNLTFEEAIK